MDKEEVRSALQALIGEVMPELGEVDLGKNIVTEYGVNSISIIRLIVAAENRFGISFSDYDLDLDSYETFGDLAETIREKLEAKEEE